jgi:nicotinamide-nucleotide amidase
MANKKNVEAVILCVGNELLNGKTVNFNAAEMSRLLGLIGVVVTRQLVLPDIQEKIVSAIRESKESAILITGGLGPTSDDLTADALAAAFKMKMRYDQGAADHVVEFFKKRGRVPTESNFKQALVPQAFEAVANPYGTAPFLSYFHKKTSQHLFAMPGVPREMRGLMNDFVLPTLKKSYALKPIFHYELLTLGIGESNLFDMVKQFRIPTGVSLAFLPEIGSVTVRFSGTDEALILKTAKPFRKILLPYLVSDNGDNLEITLQKKWIQKKWKLALAESCTGGLLSQRLTAHAGASDYFLGSAVVYSNAWKTKLLGVPPTLLKKYGAVSQETAVAMAECLRKNMRADSAVAITGIAGPGGGTAEKPVGTVWIAVSLKHLKKSQVFQFSGSRKAIQERAATESLNLLWTLAKNF